MSKKSVDSDEEKKPKVVKNTADYQRLKLEKLMKNPEKPVIIPEGPRQKSLAPPPDFVRNVMGSSAGAGSGEFHVYRHLRRKEYARQKFIQEKSEKEKLDDEYHRKIEENKRLADEKTAKKRAKRLKKKQRSKIKEKRPKQNDSKNDESSQSDSNEDSDKEEIECNDSKSNVPKDRENEINSKPKDAENYEENLSHTKDNSETDQTKSNIVEDTEKD